MSKSRLLLRIILIGLIIGLIVIGGMIYYRGRPDYYWSRAQRSIAAKDYAKARLHLTNLVLNHPKHALAYETLAQVILDEARTKNQPANYLAQPHAMVALVKAAELKPNDLDLQRRTLAALIQARQLGKAVDIAEAVHKSEPKNGDALFVLTWNAVEKRDQAKAEKLISTLQTDTEVKSSHVFQTFLLQAQLYDGLEEKAKTDESLTTACGFAERLTPEELRLLTRRDREAMLGLMLMHQARATDAGEALRRSKAVVSACQRLQTGELVDARALANVAAQSVALFGVKFPAVRLEEAQKLVRDEIAAEAEELGKLARETAGNAPVPLLIYWNDARTQMLAGQYREALQTLEDGLKMAEKLGEDARAQELDLRLLAARVLIIMRRFGEAEQHLDKLVGSDRFEGWGHLLKGSVALHEGRLEKAHSEFLQASKASGDTMLVNMSLAHTYMAQEDWGKAVAYLEKLQIPVDKMNDEQKAWHMQLLGDGKRVHLDLLRAQLKQNTPESIKLAKEHLKVLRNDPDLAPAAWGLYITWMWEDTKDKNGALDLLRKARAPEKYADDLGLLQLEVRFHKEEGDFARAATAFQQYAAAKPADERRQLAYAQFLLGESQPDNALKVLAAMERQPQMSEAGRTSFQVLRLQALFDSNQIEQAKAEADRMVQNAATASAGYFMKANFAFRERDNKAGVEYLKKAHQANPNNPHLRMLLGRVLSQTGDFAGVVEVGSDVLGISKLNQQATAQVGAALRKLVETEGPEKALAKIDELLATHPNDLALLVLKVDLLLRLDRSEEGMQVLSTAAIAAPNDPNIPRLKAQAYLLRKDYELALAEAKKSLQIQDGEFSVLVIAADAALGLKNYVEAQDFGRRAVLASRESPQGYLKMAEALRAQEQYEKAVMVLQEYAKIKPDDHAIIKTLAEMQRQAGKVEEALTSIRQARSKHSGDMRYVVMEIDLLLAAGRKEDAQLLARDIASSSTSATDLRLLSETFLQRGELEDAQRFAEQGASAADAKTKPDFDLYLGQIYRRRGNPADGKRPDPSQMALLEKSRMAFASVLANPTRRQDIVAGNNLAWLLVEYFERPADAVKVIDQVRGERAWNAMPAQFVDTAALAYRKAGEKKTAIDLLKTWLANGEQQPALLYQLGLLLADEQPEQARKMLNDAVKIGLPPTEDADAKRLLKEL